jgi:tRNA (guanine-N7-)-methyltransferase
MAEQEDTRAVRRRLPGRRRGRPLRSGLKSLVERRLPALSIALPTAGRPCDPAAWFAGAPRRIWVEIGFGSGEHLAWQAAANPSVGLIGAEIFLNGIAALLRAVDEAGLGNVRVFQGDGRDLVDALPDASVERIFILFPDPWRKARHHKRRLIRTETLEDLARVLSDCGELRIATDHAGYLAWILEHAGRHPDFEWLARRPADWRCRPADWPATRYETKALAAGRAPVFLRFRRRARRPRRPGGEA